MRALVTWISRCVRAGPGTNGNEWDDEETTIVVVLDQFKKILFSNRGHRVTGCTKDPVPARSSRRRCM